VAAAMTNIDAIRALVSRFADHLSEYKSGAYGAQRAKPLVPCAAYRRQATSLIPNYARPMAVLFRLRDNESHHFHVQLKAAKIKGPA